MEKKVHYHHVKFSREAIRSALNLLLSKLNENQIKNLSYSYDVTLETEEWRHDNESEFFADYSKDCKAASLTMTIIFGKYRIWLSYIRPCTNVWVSAPERSIIEELHQIFAHYSSECAIPSDMQSEEKDITIFIGHGRSGQWRDIKDHLQDQHGYKIEAYEIGARAGHSVRDILEDMMAKSSIAILVMTGEDMDKNGILHSRENVIHELGLFQGKLGFPRAIILLEEGTNEFSNIHGIHQIRYSKNNIKETFGDILATLRREFTENSDYSKRNYID